MITIFYNEFDPAAADVALKLQSLCGSMYKSKIFICPRHNGRNVKEVNDKMIGAIDALFLAHNTLSIEGMAQNDIAFFKEMLPAVNIKYVVPVNFKMGAFERMGSAHNIYRYRTGAQGYVIINDLHLALNRMCHYQNGDMVDIMIALAIMLFGIYVDEPQNQPA